MARENLNDLSAFVAVAQARSFTKAAADLRPHVIIGLDLGDQPGSVDRPHPHVNLDRSMSRPNDMSSTQAANWLRTPCNLGYAKAVGGTLTGLDQRRSGALLSSDDFGSSVERTAKLHPLWHAS